MMSYLLRNFHNTFTIKVFPIFFFFSLVFTSINAQQAVTSVTTSTQPATFTQVGSESWGNGNDIFLETITIGGNVYSQQDLILDYSFVRVDNTVSSGERCRVFVEKIDDTTYVASYPVDENGDCSMETALKERIVNRGALDVFHNKNVSNQRANNIERVDVLFGSALSTPALVAEAGFLASEKAGNNQYKAAAVLTLKPDGTPATYGALVHIDDQQNDYGILAPSYEYRFIENGSTAPHGLLEGYGGADEENGYTLLTFQDLGLSEGDVFFGISFFGKDVNTDAPDFHILSDPTTFPDDTNEGADIYGGLGTLFITANVPARDLVLSPLATHNYADVKEDTNLTDSGNVITDNDGEGVDVIPTGSTVSIIDLDGNTVSGSTNITGNYGALDIDTDGSYTYTLDNNNPIVEALGLGETLVDTFTYTIEENEPFTTNSDFEDVPPGTNTLDFNATLPNDWLSLNSTPDIIEQAITVGGMAYNASPTGGYFNHLAVGQITGSPTKEKIGLVISGMEPGKTYTVSWDQTISNGNFGYTFDDAFFTVDIDGTSHTGNVLSMPVLGVAAPWESEQFTFVAASTSDTLKFTVNLVAGGNDRFSHLGLDNVKVTGPPDVASAELRVRIEGNNITTAQNDINQTPQDIAVSGNLLTNDTDPENDTQTVDSATYLNGSGVVTNLPLGSATDIYDTANTLVGSINLSANGSYDFTPAADYTGTFFISYVVIDDNTTPATDAATLSVEVIENAITRHHKNSIIAQDDTNTTEQGETVSTNILSNDNDPDDLFINVFAATASDGAGGLVSLDANPKDIYDANNVLAGQAYIDAGNNIIFTASANYEGEVVIDYTIQGSSLTFDDAILTITVEPSNATDNDTYANDDAGTGFQKETIIGNILNNDYDPENDTQTVDTATSSDGTAITPGAVSPTDLAGIGTLEIGTDGAYTFIPEIDFRGTETIVYTVCDDGSSVACETATLYLTSLPTNYTLAENDINQTPLNTVSTGNVLTNDTDEDGDAQTVQSAQHMNVGGTVSDMVLNTATDLYDFDGTLAGSITLDTDGTYEFTPVIGYVGTAPMRYTVEDDNDLQATNSAFLMIEVLANPTTDGSNNSVIAQDDTNVVAAGETVTSIVLANDSDPDGDTILITTATATNDTGGTLTLTSTPQNIYDQDTVLAGQASIDANENIIFTADANFYDEEVKINYTATDGTSTDNAILTIIVEPANSRDNDTHTNDDANTGLQGIGFLGNILTNDYDPEGDIQTIGTITSSDGTAITAGAASPTTLTGIGTLEIGTDGSYAFVPVSSFVGTEAVSYTVCDDNATQACETSTLYLTSLPVENSTTAIVDYNNTPYETLVLGNVSTNDYDNEGDNQTFDLNGVNGGMNTAEGAVTISPSGNYKFIPAANFSGETSFSYQVCDDAAAQACETATVYIEVLPIVTPEGQPVIANVDANTVTEGLEGTGNVLSNDLDPDGGTLTVSTTTSNTVLAGTDEDGNTVPNAATLTLNTDGTYTIISTGGFVGIISYPYTACNDATPQECDNSLLIINVIPNNGNTTFANDDAILTDLGMATTGNLANNDKDAEGDTQEISSYLYDSNGDGISDALGTIGASTTIGGTNANGVFIANAGTLELNDTGTYTFTPATGFVGNAIIAYTTCDDAISQACDDATLVITVQDVNSDYGDGPAVYPAVWHRAISDVDNNQVLDGSSNVWLGSKTDFETTQSISAGADMDDYDDAMSFGTGIGQFPIAVAPLQVFDVSITLNREQNNDEVFYGMWIDWNADGTYDNFYNGSDINNGANDVTITVTAPADITGSKAINVRLRADDDALNIGDFSGARTNGEVEDHQGMVVLPVELVSFEGMPKGCDVQLHWLSETEENFSHYEIEWSNDNLTWKTIETIEGTGGISSQYYQYVHKEASDKNYYRLKMVDLDDTYEYSKIVNILTDCSIDEGMVTLYPNPVLQSRGDITLRFFAEIEMQETIIITDMLGREIKQINIDVNTNWNQMNVDISYLPTGTYHLRLKESDIFRMFIIAE